MVCPFGRAQEVPAESEPLWRQPIFGPSLAPLLTGGVAPAVPPPAGQVPRLRLFHMPSGFLAEPLGLVDNGDDAPSAETSDSVLAGAEASNVQVSMGLDNPYFDYRWRNDPGGVGFYKVHSQVQLLNEGKTCVSLAVQAVTPAGLENGGVSDGPTVFVPAVAWFQELGGGAALQGFVAKNIKARSGWTDDLETGVHYGMALQCADPGLCNGPKTGLHFFVEALGKYRFDGESASTRAMSWELIPGLHWQMGEKWWLSFGAARTSVLTCSWHF
jgi:hypothetical protein